MCSFKVLFITFGYTRFFSLYFSRTQTIPHCHYGLQILYRLSPTYLQDTFKYTTTVTSHVDRNSHRLFVPRVRTTYGKNSLFYIGMQVWNSLHASFYTAATLGQFKHLQLYKSNFKYNFIIIVCYHVYRALLKSSSFLLIAVFPLTIKNVCLPNG